MSKKIIKMALSEEGITRAIAELDAYTAGLERKTKKLTELIAERVAWSASSGFATAIADDIFTGNADRPTGNVSVTVEQDGDICVVIADGEDAVFIEFGAGVYYNGSPGTSPHPKGNEHGFLIGEYGKKQGRKRVWALPGSTAAEPILTHGTPAAMPMYRGVREAVGVIDELAREVFG